MARSLALRALAGAGAFVQRPWRWAPAGPARRRPRTLAPSPSRHLLHAGPGTGPVVVRLPLCGSDGWDVCGGNNGGGGGGPGNGGGNGPGGPPTTVAAAPTTPTTAPPVTVSPGVPVATLPPATLPPPTPPPATTAPPATQPPAPPPPTAAAAAAEQAPSTAAARTTPTNPTTAAATTAATTAATAPATQAVRTGGLVEAEVLARARHRCAAGRRARASADGSFAHPLRSSTRRPVRSAAVSSRWPVRLLAVAVGILAATIDDRTQLVRRIQERRHVDEH